ncbi:hypothetical protein AB0P05_37135 [Streptomyces flaveolus]|uniref:hypothetical protein n=1 Tax=Streptomyces flaveolus TaxID=67297 RepID=UPI003446D767
MEIALRELIRKVLGPNWGEKRGAPDLERLREKQEEDRKRRDGAIVNDDLLAYTELYSLTQLIEKNWESFKPAFGDSARTKVFLGILADFRNPVAHSRQLLPFERELLSGAAGQLRNQVSLFLSRDDGPHRYYSSIESVTDSFGNLAGSFHDADRFHTGIRLNVGDRLSFHCMATDPRGREILWRLEIGTSTQHEEIATIAGVPAELIWEVEERHVGEKRWVRISAAHTGRFHRRGDFDDERFLTYNVNPPAGD